MTDYPPFQAAKPKPASGNPPDEETPPGAEVTPPRRGRPRQANGPTARLPADVLSTLSIISEELAQHSVSDRKDIVAVLHQLLSL